MATSQESFQVLIERLRRGDEQAAAELVDQYGPEVQRYVRFRLFSSNLRRFVDSLDVSQSVLARFFVQLEAGEIDLQGPQQLRKLLLTMARNKLNDVARHQQAQKRNARRVVSDEFDAIAAPDQTPSDQIAAEDLLMALQNRLSPQERHLVERRLAGTPWDALAVELNSTAEAMRKQMARALDRAARELGVLE